MTFGRPLIDLSNSTPDEILILCISVEEERAKRNAEARGKFRYLDKVTFLPAEYDYPVYATLLFKHDTSAEVQAVSSMKFEVEYFMLTKIDEFPKFDVDIAPQPDYRNIPTTPVNMGDEYA